MPKRDVRSDVTKRSPFPPEREMSFTEQQYKRQQAEGSKEPKREREESPSKDTQRSEQGEKRAKVENELPELIIQKYEYLKDHYREKGENHFSAFKKAKEIVEEKETHIQESTDKVNTAFMRLDTNDAYVRPLKDHFKSTLEKLEKNHRTFKEDLRTEYSKKDARDAHNCIKELSQAPLPTTSEDLDNFRASLAVI